MSRPIILFGPPKTSTSFIYRALCEVQEYSQTAVKEWSYLRSLYLYGSLGYVERLGVYHDALEYHLTWNQIHCSYLEHLKFLENKPINYVVLNQLKHSQALIFEKHEVSSYLKLFNDIEDSFRFDLDPLNHTVSSVFLKRLINTCPEALFVCGVRPFLPHFTSLVLEIFSWFDPENLGTLDMPTKSNDTSEDMVQKFQDYLTVILSELLYYYEALDPETVENMDLNKSIATNLKSIHKINPSELVARKAVLLYLHTNTAFRLKKLTSVSRMKNSVYYYYSPNISQGLFDLTSWLQSKGIKVGPVEKNLTTSKIRESNKEFVSKIFDNNHIIELTLSCEKACSNFHLGKIHESMHSLIFPEIKLCSSGWYDMCRKIDGASQLTTIDITRV